MSPSLDLTAVLPQPPTVLPQLYSNTQIWSTSTFEPLYIIHPCDDTSGDIYSLAWDNRAGGTLYFGAQNTSIEWVNFARLPGAHEDAAAHACANPTVIRSASRTDSTASLTLEEKLDKVRLQDAVTGPSPVASPVPSVRSGRYKPHSFFDTPPADVRSGSCTPRTPGLAAPFASADLAGRLREDRRFSSPGMSRSSSSLRLDDGLLSRGTSPGKTAAPHDVVEFELDVDTTVFYAHYGYVYALEMVSRADGGCWLASGSGDSDVKIWECAPGGGLTLIREFSHLPGAVLSLTSRDSLLYAGLQDGEIDVWDLETGSRIRTIDAHHTDVMAMLVLGCDVYTGAADGDVRCIDDAFDCTASFKAHDDPVLTMAIVPAAAAHGHEYELITAGNDSFLKIWAISAARTPVYDIEVDVDIEGSSDVMLYALKKLIALPTISDEAHRESCRQGAHLLKKILGQLGAVSEIIPGDQGRNPLVLATFSGRETGTPKPRKRVLFYGHYDVQPVGEKDWESDPWVLTGRDGYLYGRGVTDNKGPILAVACAAAELRQRRELDVDLVMLIEGEEEAGSRGFAEAVRKHRVSY
jgi:di- and tripeptidase